MKKDIYKKTLHTKKLEDFIKLSYYIDVNSDYIWKGQTLSQGDPSINSSLELGLSQKIATSQYFGVRGATTKDNNSEIGTELNLYTAFNVGPLYIGFTKYKFSQNKFKNLSGIELYADLNMNLSWLPTNPKVRWNLGLFSPDNKNDFSNESSVTRGISLKTDISAIDASINLELWQTQQLVSSKILDDYKEYQKISVSKTLPIPLLNNAKLALVYNKSKVDPNIDGVSFNIGFNNEYKMQ